MLVGPPVQVPITGKVLSVACAPAAIGQAAAPPRIVMNSRRLMFPSDRTSQPTIFLQTSRDMCIAEKASLPDAATARRNYSVAIDPGVFAREAILRRTMSM